MEVGAGAGAGASPPPPSGVSSLGSAFSHQSGCAVNLHVSLTFTEVAAPHRETETARTTTRPRRQAAPAGEAMSIREVRSERASEREILVSWRHGAGVLSSSLVACGREDSPRHACQLVEVRRTSQAYGGRPFHEVNGMFSILTE